MFRIMENIYSILTIAIPAKLWQLRLLAFVITNIKCFPLIWHVRRRYTSEVLEARRLADLIE